MKIKKYCVMCIMIVLALATLAGAVEYTETSGEQTADAAIMAAEGLFFSILVMPDGTNAVTVSIYDNASAASGTEIVPTLTFAGDGGAQTFAPPYPIHCHNGIYVDVTVAGGGSVGYAVQKRAGL